MGVVFDIARCSYHDGPGIRTTVFLKGCNLRCPWCHNPESFDPQPQIEWTPALCVSCGACASVCPNGVHQILNGTHRLLPAACTRCGACVAACPQNALQIAGRDLSAEDVLEIVKKDRAYYENSGGGVTFSGGEPTCQPAFLLDLLNLCRKESIHTALETNGCIPQDLLGKLLPLVDLFLLDCKADDAETLRKWTGGDFSLWQQTLDAIEAYGTPVVLRLPIIPGFNDTDAHFAFAAALSQRCRCIESVEILPYHTIGNGKWTGIGLTPPLRELPAASEQQRRLWNQRLSDALSACAQP